MRCFERTHALFEVSVKPRKVSIRFWTPKGIWRLVTFERDRTSFAAMKFRNQNVSFRIA